MVDKRMSQPNVPDLPDPNIDEIWAQVYCLQAIVLERMSVLDFETFLLEKVLPRVRWANDDLRQRQNIIGQIMQRSPRTDTRISEVIQSNHRLLGVLDEKDALDFVEPEHAEALAISIDETRRLLLEHFTCNPSQEGEPRILSGLTASGNRSRDRIDKWNRRGRNLCAQK